MQIGFLHIGWFSSNPLSLLSLPVSQLANISILVVIIIGTAPHEMICQGGWARMFSASRNAWREK